MFLGSKYLLNQKKCWERKYVTKWALQKWGDHFCTLFFNVYFRELGTYMLSGRKPLFIFGNSVKGSSSLNLVNLSLKEN